MAADARQVVETYFAALEARDLDGMAACWAPDGVDNLVGQVEAHGPGGVRAYFGELFAAVPDFHLSVDEMIVEGDRAAVLWRADGTFAGEAAYQGIAPTGGRVRLTGLDLLRVRDGLIVRNDAYPDGLGFARQVGLLPAQGSGMEARVARVFNARTSAARRLAGSAAEPVAEGVWRVRGGVPRSMNVYLIEDDGGGVTVYDAGVESMVNAVGAAASGLGGVNRVVLGHGHPDHRGVAPGLGAPVFCHPDDREQTEGDGGRHYFDYAKLRPYARPAFPHLLDLWDGGPVEVAGTIAEGEDVSGFRAVHLPGHSPGLIALFRERDGVALTSDCFYTLDPQTGIHGHPRVPHAAFNLDTEQARASIRKLAELTPSAAWPGHAEPLTGDVAAQLEQAAATT
jgi:glyoxylase-like metal-dependent hydrolase (beta-lactamase superfamily II)/ketosteroid isomerase-like protein